MRSAEQGIELAHARTEASSVPGKSTTPPMAGEKDRGGTLSKECTSPGPVAIRSCAPSVIASPSRRQVHDPHGRRSTAVRAESAPV